MHGMICCLVCTLAQPVISALNAQRWQDYVPDVHVRSLNGLVLIGDETDNCSPMFYASYRVAKVQ
eukprot:2851440-Amphidinium_carterae.1